MSKMFGEMKTEGLEKTQDRLGGYAAQETGMYTGKIKMAYAGASLQGARFIALIVDFDGNEYRETVYFTNKKGENFYADKNDTKKKVPLPGFTTIDDICVITTGLSLSEQETEEKLVKVYDTDAKAEVPKSVPVLIELIGKEISLGILKTEENKTVKDGSGAYVATAEVKQVNNIDKVFDTETKMTVIEARAGLKEGAFWDAWEKRNKGVTRDKKTFKEGAAGAPGRPAPANAPPGAGAAAPARSSLFGKKAA